ncbi:MAG: hypothetical protein GY679_01920 [Mycoplasma sp.]|nr:hypothetical protein [Mycoplasma sp.]
MKLILANKEYLEKGPYHHSVYALEYYMEQLIKAGFVIEEDIHYKGGKGTVYVYIQDNTPLQKELDVVAEMCGELTEEDKLKKILDSYEIRYNHEGFDLPVLYFEGEPCEGE